MEFSILAERVASIPSVSTEVKDSTDGSILVKQSGSFFSEIVNADWFYGFDVQFDCPVCLVELK